MERSPARKRDGSPDTVATELLVDQFARVDAAARACTNGFLSIGALKDAGFRLATLQDPQIRQAEMQDLEAAVWSRWCEPEMWPEMSLDERREETVRCKINVVLRRQAAMLQALDGIVTRGEAGAGLISCVTDVTARGDHSRLIIRGQKPAADWLTELPVLNLNATANLELARLMFSDIVMPRAERLHASTHQVLGRWGRRYLAKHPKIIAELRAFIRLKMIGRRKGLVVVYKDIKHLFQGIPDVETAHHGDILGDDTHRGHDFLLVIGGAFADHADTASIAAGRGAGAVPIAPPVPVTRIATLASGTAVAIPGIMAYAHPGFDAAHDSIFAASVIQATGRIDQFRRTAADTCVVYVMANVILDRQCSRSAGIRACGQTGSTR